ncbi:MAG: T9SS type A sorting domain-containing protein [Bacteroidota bacterium]
MKTKFLHKIKSVLLVLFFTTGLIGTMTAQTFLSEGFEGGALPTGWTQEYVTGTNNWIYANGGHSGLPVAAHTGSYNAQFYYGSYANYTTKLVTPAMNINLVTNPTLTFWHAQMDWSGDVDEHRIYYKTSSGGPWNLLATYTAAIAAWTQEVIALPNGSSTYYIAFEGTAQWGYGVCIDDVTVTGTYPIACGNTGVSNLTPTASWQNAPYVSGTIPYWSFTATAGTWYDFSLCSNSEDTYMTIYNSAGVLQTANDDDGPFCTGFAGPASISWLCGTTGTYYVSAAHFVCNNFVSSGNLEYRSFTRACADCAPADAALGDIGLNLWGYNTTGNLLDGGKWSGSFTGKAGSIYHFDLCPDAPGAGTADFDVDIKITDSSCNILDGVDGSCTVADHYRPNDFTWTCPANGTYYVILAPFPSYYTHSCTGTASNTFTMNYYREPKPLVCPAGAIAESEPDCMAGYVDATNGGCNSTPSVFTILPSNCSDVLCGTSGNYDVSGSTYRDTDWIQFSTSDSTDVFIDAIAQFDLTVGLIDGNAGCPVSSFITFATALEGDSLHLPYVLGPGTWWLWVAPSNWNGWPCGSKYVVSLQTVAKPIVPIAAANPSCGPTTLNPIPDGHFESSFWQGTSCGTLLTDVATNPYAVTNTGTYYVRSINSATGCWSECTSVDVFVNTPGTLTANANGNPAGVTVCPSDIVTLGAAYSLTAVDTLLYRWSVAGTVIRDWDADPTYVVPTATDTTYTVEVRDYYGYTNNNVLYMYGDDNSAAGLAFLRNDVRIGAVDSLDIRLGTPSVAQLQTYGVVLIYTDFPPMSPMAMGDTLKKFVDLGGKLVTLFAAQDTAYGLKGSYLSQHYDPIFSTAIYTPATSSIGVVSLPSHPLMQGVTDINSAFHSTSTALTAGSHLIFRWADGSVGAAYKRVLPQGGILSINFMPPYATGADVYKIIANAAAYMIGSNCTISDDVPVTVTPLPVAAGTISGSDTACVGATGVGYSVLPITGATSYIWSYTGTGATINGTGAAVTIDFSASATGGDLTVKGTNSCGDGVASSALTISINPLPGAAATITGTDTVCRGDNSVTYSIATITDADTYNWNYTGADATLTGTGNSVTIDFGAGATSGTLTVAGHNGCGNGTVSAGFTIVVNTVPAAAAAISGPDTACQGTTGVYYSLPVLAGATTYIWGYTGTGVTINGSGSGVTLDFNNSATSGNLTIHGHNDCGDGVASPAFAIYVDPCSGIEAFDAAKNVSVVPNPNPGVFSVIIIAKEKTTYIMKIVDVLGKTVTEKLLPVSVGENRVEMNLSNQPSGTYYLNLTDDNNKIVKSILIAR